MAKIWQMIINRKNIFLDYDDTDIQTDYFHSTTGTIKRAIEMIKKDGADKIIVSVVNDDEAIPAMRRLKRIAKECGYKIEDKSGMHTYRNDVTNKRLEYWLLKENKAEEEEITAKNR